jgi:hypothetical protein
MKTINAGATLLGLCFYLLIGFVAAKADAGEYYIYQDSKGGLVVSNQKPPPGSKIIKQQTLLDTAEGETTLVQDGNEIRPNAIPSKPSNKE